MDKLDALRVLSNAYWYLISHSPLSKHGADLGDSNAIYVLSVRFHTVRRSLQSLEDLRPAAVEEVHEGYNGRMPAYF